MLGTDRETDYGTDLYGVGLLPEPQAGGQQGEGQRLNNNNPFVPS